MVYVAYGALLASLPVLFYAYKQHGRRAKLQSPLSGEADRAPKIITADFKEGGDKNVSKDSYDVLRHSDLTFTFQVYDRDNTSEGRHQGRDLEGSNKPLGGAADISKPEHEKHQSSAKHAATEDGIRGMGRPETKMQPPARPGPRMKPKANDKMRPPALPQQSNNSLRAPPTLSSTLRPPPSAASTLRTPRTNSLAPPTLSAAPTASTLPSSKRPSKKVILEPGHSPLDWASLISDPPSSTYLRGEDVPSNLIRVTPSLLCYHNGRKGKNAWAVWQGKVYNMTPYMKFHPGGINELMKGAGREKDAERLFLEIHPWVNWEGLLGECLVGILVSEEETKAVQKGSSGLEEMD
ncbi:MAG: hypothetical protein Q9170_003326 [Blastenia crenularia]